MKTLRGILIDPYAKTITEHQVAYTDDNSKTLKAIHDLIQADCFDTMRPAPDHMMFLDDLGLERQKKFFDWADYPQPLAGRGLILGCNQRGETIACTLTLDYVTGRVHWANVRYVGSVQEIKENVDTAIGKATTITNTPVFEDDNT